MVLKRIICAAITVIFVAVSAAVPISAANEIQTVTSISAYAKSETSIKVQWKKVIGAENYYVYYSTDKKTNYQLYKSTTKKSITVKGLDSDTKYYFRIKVAKTVDGKTQKSAFSKAASATTKKGDENVWQRQFEYWMNPESFKVHHNYCWTLKHYENFIGTNNLNEAIDKGYERCGVCFK